MSYFPNHRSRDGEYIWKSTSVDFWSGTDARVEIRSVPNNFVVIPDIVNIQLELMEAVQPVYSYASFTPDFFMRGARRVQGALTMNFRSEGFLYALLEKIDDPILAKTNTKKRTLASEYSKNGLDLDGFITLISSGNQKAPPNTIKRYSSSPELVKKYTSDLQDTFWGTVKNSTANSTTNLISSIARNKPKFPTSKNLELFIEFGHNTPNDEISLSKFRQSINLPNNSAAAPLPQRASRIIRNLQFNGISSQYDDSGRPIMEIYTFVASDLT